MPTKDDIGGFDISMNKPLRMEILGGLQQLLSEAQDHVNGHAPVVACPGETAQVTSLQELKDHVESGTITPISKEIEHLHDIRVLIQLSERIDLSQQEVWQSLMRFFTIWLFLTGVDFDGNVLRKKKKRAKFK